MAKLKELVVRIGDQPCVFGSNTAFRVHVTSSRAHGDVYLVLEAGGKPSVQFDTPDGYHSKDRYKHLRFVINNVYYVSGNFSNNWGNRSGWINRGWGESSPSVAALNTWYEIGEAILAEWAKTAPKDDAIRQNELRIKYDQASSTLEIRRNEAESAEKKAQLAEAALNEAQQQADEAYTRWKLDTEYDNYLTLSSDEQAFTREHLDETGTLWATPADLLTSARDTITRQPA